MSDDVVLRRERTGRPGRGGATPASGVRRSRRPPQPGRGPPSVHRPAPPVSIVATEGGDVVGHVMLSADASTRRSGWSTSLSSRPWECCPPTRGEASALTSSTRRSRPPRIGCPPVFLEGIPGLRHARVRTSRPSGFRSLTNPRTCISGCPNVSVRTLDDRDAGLLRDLLGAGRRRPARRSTTD